MSQELFDRDLFAKMLEDLGVDASDEALAHMPEPGAAYPAGTWIAPWSAQFGYWFMAQEDPADVEDEEFVRPDLSSEAGDWFHYFYFDYKTAQEMHEGLGLEYRPQEAWIFWTEKANVVNRDQEVLKDFSDMLVTHSLIKSLMVGGAMEQKNRHQFNLISQPCGVAAVARYLGIDLSFNIEELLHYNEKKQEAGFDAQKFFEDYCGDPHGDYQESVLYKRRVELWNALGEQDATKTAAMGTKLRAGGDNQNATSSPHLSDCIRFAQGDWNKKIWCRVAFVPNPHPSEVSPNTGRPYTFPALIEIFHSEEEARKVGAEEISEATGHPPVPENWASAGAEEFIQFLTEKDEDGQPKRLDGMPNPGQAANIAAEAYCTAEEVIAWAEYLREQGEI